MTSWQEKRENHEKQEVNFFQNQEEGGSDDGASIIVDKQALLDKVVTASITGIASAVTVNALMRDD